MLVSKKLEITSLQRNPRKMIGYKEVHGHEKE